MSKGVKANTSMDQVISALLARMDKTDAVLASFVDTSVSAKAPAKPKAEPAKLTAPTLAIDVVQGRHEVGLVLRLGQRKCGRFIAKSERPVIKADAARIDAEFKKLGSK